MAEEIIFKVSADTSNADKNVTKLESDMIDLAKAHEQVANANRNVNSTFEEVYGNMKPLSASLGELEDRMYNLALSGLQNTEEFKELQAEAVRFRQVLISVDRSVDQLAEQGRGLGAALQIGTAVTAGYGAIQGGMALLGSESEQLQKTFVKLQAVQTILASLEQLKIALDKESIVVTKAKAIATAVMTGAQTLWTTVTAGTTVAMGALRLAMLALPIVAIVAGIMALISAIAFLVSEEEKAEAQNEAINKTYEKQIEVMARAEGARKRKADNALKMAELEGASEEELHALKLKNMYDEEVARNKMVGAEKTAIEGKKQAYQQALREENFELAKTIREEIEQHRKKYLDMKSMDGAYHENKKLLEKEFSNQQAEKVKAEAEKDKQDSERASQEQQRRNQEALRNKKAHDEKIRKAEEEAQKLRQERANTIEDLMTANIEDSDLRSLMQLQTKHRREREELVAKFGQDTELLKQLAEQQSIEVAKVNADISAREQDEKDAIKAKEIVANRTQQERINTDKKAFLESELIRLRDNFEAEQEVKAELIEFERATALQNKDLTEGELFLIDEQYNEKKRILAEERANHEKQLQEDVKQATIQTGTQGLDALQGLSDAFFGNKLDKAQKGSAAELAIQKKQFDINKKLQIAQAVMQGIQAVQAAYSSGSAIPIVGAVTGPAFAALAAITSLANVNRIKNTNFEGGGASVATPSVATPTIPSAADVVGGTEGNSTLTDGLQGSGGVPAQSKVVLVDSDVKASLKNDEQVKMISTFG